MTCRQMKSTEFQKVISLCSPNRVKIKGDTTATTKLLIKVYAARQATLPPSIPVITAAAVAVGAKTQIRPPCATIEPHQSTVNHQTPDNLNSQQPQMQTTELQIAKRQFTICNKQHTENQVGR